MTDGFAIPGADITIPDEPLDDEETRALSDPDALLYAEGVRGWSPPAGRQTTQVAVQLPDARVLALHYEVPGLGSDIVEDGEWRVAYDSGANSHLDADTLNDRVRTSLKHAYAAGNLSMLDDKWHRGAVIPRSQTDPDGAGDERQHRSHQEGETDVE